VARSTILVLTNLFPPHYFGGYELACADVVEGLRKRGWHPLVLTSSGGTRLPPREPAVLRLLQLNLPGMATPRRTMAIAGPIWNRFVLQVVSSLVSARILHVFNPSGLGGLLLDGIHSQPRPVVHDVSDPWLLDAFRGDFWFNFVKSRAGTRPKRIAKAALLRGIRQLLPVYPIALDLTKSYFRSHFLKEQFARNGMIVDGVPIIHHGIRIADFATCETPVDRSAILFAGRISPEKGVHVMLQAVGLLKDKPLMLGRRISVVGPSPDLDYWHTVQKTARQITSSMQIDLRGQIPRRQVPNLLANHGIFVLPAVWDEPFSIGLLEAMAAGLAVVATSTGGSSEVLRDGENALVVRRDDPRELADALLRVLSDDDLRRRLARGARESVRRFDLDQSIDAIESHIHHVAT